MILAQALLLAWLLLRFLPRRFGWLAFILAAGALIPLNEGVSLAMALRALWGDPSVTTLQLITLSVVGRTPALFQNSWRVPAAIAVSGLLFYPLALGAGDFDPYRLGYQPALLVMLFAIPALTLWWRGQHMWLWILAVDLAAFAAHLLESTNFWDYVMDPLLISACVVLTVHGAFSRTQTVRE